MNQVHFDQHRSSSKSTSSVQEESVEDESSTSSTLTHSGEASKEVSRIMQGTTQPAARGRSAPGRLQVESEDVVQDLTAQARSQSLLVELDPQKQTSRLQQFWEQLSLPKLLGGRNHGNSKVSICSPASFSSTPRASDLLESALPLPPSRPAATAAAVLRARTWDMDGVHELRSPQSLRSPELDSDPSDAWSLIPNSSFLPTLPTDGDFCYISSRQSCATDRSDRGTLQSLRHHLLELLEEPFGSCRASVLSVFLIVNNSTSFVLLCMESPVMEASSRSRDIFESSHGRVQLAVNVMCTIEALVRFWCRPRQRRSLGHIPNAIDAGSVLPFWLIKVIQLDIRIEQPALYLACRLEFGLRLLKLCRYFEGWQLLFLAISDALPALMLPLVALGYIVGLGACLILVAEEAYMLAGGEETTLSGFPDALMFCWLCIVAIDEGPFWELGIQSKVGRLIVGALMMCGLVVFAMPISIVGTCFCRVWFQRHRLLFLEALRRRVERESVTDTTTTLKELFDAFDQGHCGELGLQEFKRFSRSVFPWLSAATVLTIFSSFDQDQDGAVSFQEVQAAVFPEEADLEFLINVVEEKDMRDSQEQDCSLFEEGLDESQGPVLFESHASGSSNDKDKEADMRSVRSEDVSHTGVGSMRCSSEDMSHTAAGSMRHYGSHASHSSSHPATAQAAATAQAVRLLGVLDNRLRSLEKRQHQIPITPWYALAPPSPAKSLLSTRRSSLKSQPGGRPNSTNATSNRGHWSSQNSMRSSKMSNISAAYTDVPSHHGARKHGRDFDDASSSYGMLLGTSSLPSATSSRCPSVTTSITLGEHAGNRRMSTTLSQIADVSTDSRSTRSSQSVGAREPCWARSRRNTIAGVVRGSFTSPTPEEPMTVQDEKEDETSQRSEAGGISKVEIPIMQVTRKASNAQESSGIEAGSTPATTPAANLAPPQLNKNRVVSRSPSPSRRVSKTATAPLPGSASYGRRLSIDPSAIASMARRVSQQEADPGDEISFATGNDLPWSMPSRRNERRLSSRQPSREVGSASNSSVGAAVDNSHLR